MPPNQDANPLAAVSAKEALQRLRDGNLRFAADVRMGQQRYTSSRRPELVADQAPFAIILGCSDSRVPAEIVFDQGLGDLFVIRVAGNVVAPSQIGSIEFAATRFGIGLVVVLGHSRCGAIEATLDELRQPTERRSRNLHSIVNRIRPSVQNLLAQQDISDNDKLISQAVKANIHASVEQLRSGSEILEELIAEQQLQILGAEYSLDTGSVEFFD